MDKALLGATLLLRAAQRRRRAPIQPRCL